jgi:hypothetical protein
VVYDFTPKVKSIPEYILESNKKIMKFINEDEEITEEIRVEDERLIKLF